MKNNSQLKQQKGAWNLIEIVITLAIVGALAVSIMIFGSGPKTSQKVQQETTGLSGLIENVRNFYSSQRHYNGLTNDVLVDGRLVPKTMVVNDAIVNTWGQPVTLLPVAVNGVNDMGFTIDEDIPSSACSALVSTNEGQFVSIEVNSTEVKAIGEELDLTALTGACQADEETTLRNIVFTSL